METSANGGECKWWGTEERYIAHRKSLTGRIQQAFQDFDCPRLPKLIFCSH
ncbi:hypothetical protein Leryth_023749, partial [Lithospermum erythrorhizon]